jgi:hypothetical protein
MFAVATAAQAIESKESKTSPQSVDAVWQKVGDFCGIGQWHPAVAKCELSADKKQRTLTLKGGGTIVEHLVRWSDKMHSYTYKIVSSPLPVENYESTIRVAKSGSGSVSPGGDITRPRAAPRMRMPRRPSTACMTPA